jgi:serine/threonine protein kinase/tetratricopeptide (TPR) repeat protein
MIGKTISHYEILEKLGEGGMGVVYKAHDTKLDRTVALKFLPSHVGADENEKKRFINEAKAASALDHSNICNIHSVEETDDGTVFIVMAYYEGMSLKEKIEQGPFALKDVVNYSIQIASGLQKAHEKGIIHRDLKPANIFITNDDQIKIIDFGLARVAERTLLTKSGTTLGTVPYMSPEQAQGGKVDYRTDIWSLGVVMYEMVTGQRPFKSDYETALVYSIINEDPEPVTGARSGVPMDLERIVRKCLEKEPNDRYQYTDEMIVDLRKVANELSSGVRTKAQGGTDTMMKSGPAGRIYRKRMMPLVYGVPLAFVVLLGIYLFISGEPAVAELDRSIAVLPFENMSPDPADEFFADGITEDIINSLSKIADIRVISRHTSMRYKGTDKSLGIIGEELNVATILHGGIRRAGDDLRISVQLIEVKTDNAIWAETYDRMLVDVFVVQSEVAQNVAEALKAQLTPDEFERIDRPPTDNLAAYELYLMGRERWDFNREAQEEAAELYRMAVRLDPGFALAYAHLAHTYGFLSSRESAFEAAHRALEIDSTQAVAHWALGQLLRGTGRISEARRSFRQAIAFDPNFVWPMNDLTSMETNVGRLDEAYHWARKALEREPDDANTFAHSVDPLLALEVDEITDRFLTIGLDKEPLFEGPKPYHRISIRFATLEVLRGNYEKALQWIRDAMELHPDNDELPRSYASVLIFARPEHADSVVEYSFRISPDRGASILPATYRTLYAWVLMRRGEYARADSLLEQVLERSAGLLEDGAEAPTVAAHIAAIHSLRGNVDDAIEWLERAYDLGYLQPRIIERAPLFDNVREHQEYRRLIDRMRSDIARMRARIDFSGLPGAEDYIAIK